MLVGIYINQRPDAGGGFFESLNSISKIDSKNIEQVFFTSNKSCLSFLKSKNLNVKYISMNLFKRLILFLRYKFLYFISLMVPGNITPVILIKKAMFKFNGFEKYFIKEKVDLIFFTSPDANIIYVEHLNFCVSIWDLAHFEIPFYPELRENFTFETRDFYYRHVLPKAYAIIVGHNSCKVTLERSYGINPSKIFIIPFKASPFIRKFEDENKNKKIKTTRNKELTNYIFYPSQYAAHKNHRIVVDAFNELLKLKAFTNVFLIFTGVDRGTLNSLKKLCNDYGITKNVKFFDFQTDIEVYHLYKYCNAVVVPTHIGPGTLPSLESLYLNKYIVLPDYYFNKEYYGKSAIYYKSNDYYDLAENLKNVISLSNTKPTAKNLKKKYTNIQKSSEIVEFNNHINKFQNITKSTFINK